MSFFFNKKCPICLEKGGDMFGLECLHRLHLECCKNLSSLECPLCRKIINNFPSWLNELIEKNISKNKEESDRNEFSRTYSNFIYELSNLLIHPTPQMEVIMAVDYLRENDIPLRYIPEVVSITFFKDQPSFEVGFIFCRIVDSILEEILKDIDSVEEDDLLDLSREGVLEDHPENPFLEEDNILETINRKIRVRKI